MDVMASAWSWLNRVDKSFVACIVQEHLARQVIVWYNVKCWPVYDGLIKLCSR